MNKRQRLIGTVEALSQMDSSRYFSIAEIADASGLYPKETQAWLAVLRFDQKITAVLDDDGKYWYAPL